MAYSPSSIKVLRSGEIPSQMEQIHSRAVIASKANELAKINKEIKETTVQATIDQLTSERDSLTTCIAEHQALIAPVRRLHVELLGEIFMECLPDEFELPNAHTLALGNTLTDPLVAPLLLTQVCHAWRAASISHARLWAIIAARVDGNTDVDKLTNMVQMWLARSGGCPLELIISVIECPNVDSFIPLMNLLCLHSDRWEQVSFSMPMRLHLAVAPQRHLPLLVALRLSSTHDVDAAVLPTEFDTYKQAPRLVDTLLLNGFRGSMVSLPWHQLRALRGVQGVSNDFFALRHAPRLETCTLVNSALGDQFDPILTSTIPPLLYLSSLELVLSTGDNIAHIFSSLTCPALESLSILELELGDWRTETAWPHAVFNTFVERAPNLQRLYLNFPITSEDLIECLTHMPSLVAIDICTNYNVWTNTSPLNDALLDRLRTEPASMLPKLEGIRFAGDLKFSIEAIYLMLKSRLTNTPSEGQGKGDRIDIARLDSISLEYAGEIPGPEMMERLKDLIDEGLDVYIGENEYGEGFEL